MVEQAALAGHPVESSLPPFVEDAVPGRDYQGRVMPRSFALTVEAARSLGVDYDLAGAELRTLRVERAGDRLVGFIAVAAGRRFPVDLEPAEPAKAFIPEDGFQAPSGPLHAWAGLDGAA